MASHPLGQSTLLGELMDETHMTAASRGSCGDRRHPWHGSEAKREKTMEGFARSWLANRKKLPLPHPSPDQPHEGRAVKEANAVTRTRPQNIAPAAPRSVRTGILRKGRLQAAAVQQRVLIAWHWIEWNSINSDAALRFFSSKS